MTQRRTSHSPLLGQLEQILGTADIDLLISERVLQGGTDASFCRQVHNDLIVASQSLTQGAEIPQICLNQLEI
jgi:hypothetical protein